MHSWGANPGAERVPNGFGERKGKALENTLGNNTNLDVAVISGEFSSHGIAELIRFTVWMLVA